MDNPIEQLKNNIPNMTETQKKVADHIIRNYFDTAFATIDQLATEVGTSTTTIMRLMALLGYSGYSEFQKGLQKLLKEHVSPKMRLEANMRELDQENLWIKCYQKQMQNIDRTMQSIPTETLDRVVAQIAAARTIYVASSRGGAMVAQFFHLFLARMFGNSVLIHTDAVSEWSTVVPGADATDLAIVLSYPRYSKTVSQFAKAMKRQGTFVIGISDSYSAPLAQHSNILLLCSCGSVGFHNSPVSAMLLADCIINVTTLRYSARVKPRLEMSGAILEEIGCYDT